MSPIQPVLPLWVLVTAVSAAPALEPVAHPMITPAPVRPRDSDPSSYIASVISHIGSDVSSYVASGVPQFFQDFPTGDSVESSLSISDSDLAAKPTQVLNLP
jgi:hypothetical protein